MTESYQKQYADILRRLINEPHKVGESRVGEVRSRFVETIRVDLAKEFPLMTVKKVSFKNILHELIWFIKGDTNIKYLVENKCNIWNDDAYRYFNDKYAKYVFPSNDGNQLNIPFEMTKEVFLMNVKKGNQIQIDDNKVYTYGDLDRVYGFQWRKFNGKTDQLATVINTLKTNPDDRRMIVTAHNPTDLKVGDVGLPSCFLENTPIRNIGGEYVNISEIVVDDCVYDINGSYENVTDKSKTKHHGDIIKIKTYFNNQYIETTPNHPFYTKSREFIRADKLNDEEYLGIPINNKNEIKSFPVSINIGRGRHKEYVITPTKDDFYTFGFFLGDGWASFKDDRIYFSINKNEADRVLPQLRKTIKISKEKEYESVYKYATRNKKWINIFREFGSGAKNKKIPDWVLDSPIEYLEEFLKGYVDSDGHYYVDNNEYSITTISRNIAYGIQLVSAKLGYVSSIYFQERKPQTIIEGRVVNQNNLYQLRIRKDRKNESTSFIFSDDFLWIKIKEIKRTKFAGYVYNMSVNDSHTYNVNNFIVHNCHNYFQFYTVVIPEVERALYASQYDGIENVPERYISVYYNIRSNDFFLGQPYNTPSYALLLKMVANVVGMIPREVVCNAVDCHLYEPHLDAANEWLEIYEEKFNGGEREDLMSFSNARVEFTRQPITSIDSFTADDFEVVGYAPEKSIKAPLLT